MKTVLRTSYRLRGQFCLGTSQRHWYWAGFEGCVTVLPPGDSFADEAVNCIWSLSRLVKDQVEAKLSPDCPLCPGNKTPRS